MDSWWRDVDDATLNVLAAAGGKLTLAELAAMPQATHRLPIACVEGWSANAEWTGVVLSDLIAAMGASPLGVFGHRNGNAMLVTSAGRSTAPAARRNRSRRRDGHC